MPAVSAIHEEIRRGQILSAARECFQRHGFHRTTMRDVADEAGLSTGTLYLYFDGKDDLIRALAASGREMEDELLRPLDEAQDPVDALEEVVLGFLAAYRDDDAAKAGRLLVRYWGEALGSSALLADLDQRRANHLDRVTSAVVEAQSRGRIDPSVSSRATARLILGVITNALLEHSLNPDVDLESYAETARTLLQGTLFRPEGDA